MAYRYEKILKAAESSNGHIDIIQEVILFRCKNSVKDFLIDPNSGNAQLGYDQNGFPIPSVMSGGLVEAIDISDIVGSYSFSHENQFASSVCTFEIANINGLYSPENITFLNNADTGPRMKSTPVVPPDSTGADWSHFNLTSGKTYYEYNPNYFNNDPTLYNPMFRSNHVIKIREGMVDTDGTVLWSNVFLGLVSIISPTSEGGQPGLQVTCHDFMKLLQQSSTERTYISPIMSPVEGSLGGYYWNQKLFSNEYTKAPSNKISNFQYGFNKNYQKVDFLLGLTSHGDNRTYSLLDAYGAELTPYWSTEPTPEIYLGATLNESQKGFLVKFYNGPEPKGTPTAVIRLDSIDFNPTATSGWVHPQSNVNSSTNWCCTVETVVNFENNDELTLFSVIGEGGLQVNWDETPVDSKDGARLRGGTWFFEADKQGVAIPIRKNTFSTSDEQSGLIYWTEISGILKLPKLKVVYKCGESYGSTLDYPDIGAYGFRNVLSISAAPADPYSDVARTFSGLTGRLVDINGSGGNTETYSILTGKWTPKPATDDIPDYIKKNSSIGCYFFGALLSDNGTLAGHLAPVPLFPLVKDADLGDLDYTILYTEGRVEFVKPTYLGNEFTLYARFAHKDVTAIVVKDVIQDIIVEDIFGFDRYVYDTTPGSYDTTMLGIDTNSPSFAALAFDLVRLNDPGSFIESLKLDNASTKNCFDAVQKLLGATRSNFKVKADATGRFIGRTVVQAGGPIPHVANNLTYHTSQGDPYLVQVSAKPRTVEITEREFYSVSAIGLNLDQERAGTANTRRRETLINGEVVIDKPNITIDSDPSYRSPIYSNIFLRIDPFHNLTFQNGRFEHMDSVDSNRKFIDNFVIYRRFWDPISFFQPQWTFERYEFRASSDFVRVITQFDRTENLKLNQYDQNVHGELECYFVCLADIVGHGGRFTDPSSPGDIMCTTEGPGIVVRPKTDIVATEIGLAPVRDFDHATYSGYPLLIDYDYKMTLVTNISSPIDDTEQLTKVKIVGKRGGVTGSDLIDNLWRNYTNGALPAANIITVPSGSCIANWSPAQVLDGITAKGKIADLSKLGLNKGWFASELGGFLFKPFKAPFKLIPPSLPPDIDNELMFPGLIVGYGRSKLSTSEPNRYIADWNRYTEYFNPTSQTQDGNFHFESATNHPDINLISGEEAARVMSFRIKVPNPGYTYELRFEFRPVVHLLAPERTDAQISLNGSGRVRLPYGRFEIGDGPYNNDFFTTPDDGLFRIVTSKTNPWIDVTLWVYHFQNASELNVYYKEKSVNSSDNGQWNALKEYPIPMSWVFAGEHAGFGGFPLNNVSSGAALDGYPGGTVHNLVNYNYGYHSTFLTTENTFLIPWGNQRTIGGPISGGNAENTVNLTVYPAPINEALQISYDPLGTYKSSMLGELYVWAGNYSDPAQVVFKKATMDTKANGGDWNVGAAPGTVTTFPPTRQIFTGSGTASSLTEQYTDFPALETSAGMKLFEINLQTEKSIGEIGVLVGFAPTDLKLDNPNEEFGMLQEFFSSTIDFLHLITRDDLTTAPINQSNYINSGFVFSEFHNGTANTIFGKNVVGSSNNECILNDGETVQLKKSFLKKAPKAIITNSVLKFEIKIIGRKANGDVANIVDWQKVHTRSEFFKFTFDSFVTTDYQYLSFMVRYPQGIAYESLLIEKSTAEKALLAIGDQWKGLLAGPRIKTSEEVNVQNYRQLFESEPARADFRWFNLAQIYVQEKDDIYAIATAETDIKAPWYNPMFIFSANRIQKNVDGVSLIVNHSMSTSSDNSATSVSDCLNGALQVLSDGIRPKESVTESISYHPGLQVNQTVWVTMGAISGFTQLESISNVYTSHPGKLMLVDKISHSKQGLVPQIQVTLRNYR